MTWVGCRYSIPAPVIDATTDALRAAGDERLEGVVLWIGQRQRQHVEILGEYVPRQIAYRSEHGVAVQIPDDEIARIIAWLPEGLAVACRVHSHPGEAYHSDTDDLNALLSHAGAISIVVPNFARDTLHLERCSVNELDDTFRWRELTARQTRNRFTVQ
jgi:hypothetical protein